MAAAAISFECSKRNVFGGINLRYRVEGIPVRVIDFQDIVRWVITVEQRTVTWYFDRLSSSNEVGLVVWDG